MLLELRVVVAVVLLDIFILMFLAPSPFTLIVGLTFVLVTLGIITKLTPAVRAVIPSTDATYAPPVPVVVTILSPPFSSPQTAVPSEDQRRTCPFAPPAGTCLLPAAVGCVYTVSLDAIVTDLPSALGVSVTLFPAIMVNVSVFAPEEIVELPTFTFENAF